MSQPRLINIGIVEDDQIMGSSLVQRFELEGHNVHWWKTGSDAVHALEFFEKDIIVCDIRLPDISGEAVMREASRDGLAPPFLFITGYGEIDQAVRLMKMGAHDYITKPFDIADFLNRVHSSARLPNEHMQQSDLLGASDEMQRLQKDLERFAQTDLPVLITGETGVGKDSAARYLHACSASAGHPFIAVNCAAIPPELLDREIFGSGSPDNFHDVAPLKGYAERVGSGTLYLNEVSRVPIVLQSKLLQLLEERRFTASDSFDFKTFDGRIVVGESTPIGHSVQSGHIREDLSFKISVLPVHISPLRDRPDDIEWLMQKMLQSACERHGQLPKSLSAEAEEAALAHNWPGNAFEMRNRIERGVALSRDQELTFEDIFPDGTVEKKEVFGFQSLAVARETAERRQIAKALEKSSGHVSEAAKLLGVSRTTLWEKMSRLNLQSAQRSES